MPRAKPHWDWVEAWQVEELKLKGDAKTRSAIRDLISAAAISDKSAAKTLVERVVDVLGNYRPARQVIDRGPRPANQFKALQIVEDQVAALSETIDRLDTRTWDELTLRGRVDLRKLRNDLAALADSVTTVQHKIDRAESRGAPEQEARQLVIALLVNVFSESGSPENETRDLEAFVRAACEIGNIKLPDDIADLLPPQ
jgi:hypothetical protein